jgi:hypothetical protein
MINLWQRESEINAHCLLDKYDIFPMTSVLETIIHIEYYL